MSDRETPAGGKIEVRSERAEAAVAAAPPARPAVLDKAAILAIPDIVPILVEVPEWGGCVWVRGLTARERDAFEASMVEVDKKTGERRPRTGNLRARLVVMGLCDEAGNRVFSDDDIPALGRKSALGMERVFDTIRGLSGMTDADLSLLEGNSNGQGDDSPTA